MEKSVKSPWNNLWYEDYLRQLGNSLIAGVDEVGRGPIAGPLVVAAVILKPDFYHPGINDSKTLSKKKIALFDQLIRDNALAISIITMSNQEIDQINIYQATKKAMMMAVEDLAIVPDFILVDAMKLDISNRFSIVGGDIKSFTISCASILAKKYRDDVMQQFDLVYPGYSFATNVGYGTAAHLKALQQLGPTPIHRQSFGPVAQIKVKSKA